MKFHKIFLLSKVSFSESIVIGSMNQQVSNLYAFACILMNSKKTDVSYECFNDLKKFNFLKVIHALKITLNIQCEHR
jgi:hypothetical protein